MYSFAYIFSLDGGFFTNGEKIYIKKYPLFYQVNIKFNLFNTSIKNIIL